MDHENILRKHALFQRSWTGWSCDHAKNQSNTNRLMLSDSDITSRETKGISATRKPSKDRISKLPPQTWSKSGPRRAKDKEESTPMVHVSIDPLSSRRSKRSDRRRPWSEGVPKSSPRRDSFEMVYEAFLPKDTWVEYKAREYVTNPRYGQLYEVRKEKPRPKPKEQTATWLWEERFRLWRLDITKPNEEKTGDKTSLGVSDVIGNQCTSNMKVKPIDCARPHADLFAAYHNQKLTNQRRDLAATVIQQAVRGWLVRKQIKDMKRQALFGLGRAWPKVTKEYRELVTRTQARHGMMKTSCPFALDQMEDYINKREKYERVFEKVAIGDKLSRDQLGEFFNECGHFPTEGEITAAFNAVFKGSGSTAEIAFVLDCSTSLGIVGFHDQMTFVKDVVRTLQIGPDRVRVAVLPFNTDVFQAFGLLQHSTQEDIVKAIDQIKFRPGLTHTHTALRIMRDVFKDARPGVQKVAIVVTDGQSGDTKRTALEAKKAADENITVFAVGVGNYVEKKELQDIARDESRVYMCSDYRALLDLKHLVGSKLCLQSDQAAEGESQTPREASLKSGTFVKFKLSTEKSKDGKKADDGENEEVNMSSLEYAIATLQSVNSAHNSGQSSSATNYDSITTTTSNSDDEKAATTSRSDSDDEKSSLSNSNDNNTTVTSNDESENNTDMSKSNISTVGDRTAVADDSTQSEMSSLRGSVQDVCRPLTKGEALDVVWTVYPPPATGLPARQSRWIRPLVDGEEAWSLLDASIIKATDFKVCLGLVVKSRLEREGVITIPSDVRAGVEEVTTYDEAMQKIEEYLEKRKKAVEPC